MKRMQFHLLLGLCSAFLFGGANSADGDEVWLDSASGTSVYGRFDVTNNFAQTGTPTSFYGAGYNKWEYRTVTSKVHYGEKFATKEVAAPSHGKALRFSGLRVQEDSSLSTGYKCRPSYAYTHTANEGTITGDWFACAEGPTLCPEETIGNLVWPTTTRGTTILKYCDNSSDDFLHSQRTCGTNGSWEAATAVSDTDCTCYSYWSGGDCSICDSADDCEPSDFVNPSSVPAPPSGDPSGDPSGSPSSCPNANCPCDDSSDLFFSEYSEGSFGNRYFEIYNPTLSTKNLNDYEWIYQKSLDGSQNPVSFDTDATIGPQETYLVCDDGADPTSVIAFCTDTVTFSWISGDDALRLAKKDGTVLDQIGYFDGQDPGTGYDVAGTSDATKDHTLLRKTTVTAGTGSDWDAAAGTGTSDSEWVVHPQDYWEGVDHCGERTSD